MAENSDKMKEMEEELAVCRQQLEKAAEFGKMLLDNNEEIKNSMDDLRISYDKKLEAAEQERYGIQLKLDQKTSMEEWYNEEISHLKQQLADGHNNLKESLEAERLQEVNKLNRQIDELRADLDQAGLNEAQMKQKAEELEELLQERLNQSTTNIGSNSSETTEEIHLLQDEVNSLQNEITNLKSQLIEKRSELCSTMTEVEVLKGKLVSRDEELEDIRCQFSSINNALEHARMEKMDLKCQLDALRMEASSHKNKGNSIFSELEDRRIDAEKKLITLRNAHSTLQEKYAVEKQQNNKYKMQVSRLLLQMSSGRVDNDYVAELEHKLMQARNELKTVMEEKSQNPQTTEVKLNSVLENGVNESEFTQYLKSVIEGKTQELQRVQQELHSKNLQLLDENSRNISQNAKINKLEAEKDKLKSQTMKFAAKLDELRQKYEPESVKKSGVLVVKRTEIIPDEGEITETSVLHSKTLNQSNTSILTEKKKPLLSHSDSKENKTDKTDFKSFTNCSKKKTVSLSDHVEVHETECDRLSEADIQPPEKMKRKVRPITAVKHISSDNVKSVKKDDCKTQ
ncbi:Protein Spindly [Mactra antiquata]